MLLSRGRLSLVLALICAACEFHVGDPDWHPMWSDDEDAGDVDAAVSRRDAAVADDAGPGAGKADAAADGGGQDAAVVGPQDAGDASAADTSTDSPLMPADVVAVLARGTCGALEACMGPRLLRDSLDGKDCVEFRTRVYADGDLHWLEKSVSLGHVVFHASPLAACERELTALGCSVQSRRLPPSCEAALEGTVTVTDDPSQTQDCAIDHQCKGVAYCDKGMLESCPGTCAKLQANSLPCSASAQCVDGLICRGGLCAEPLSEGDGCTVRGGYGECPPGLVCQGATADLQCRSIASVYTGKLGDSCDAYGELCELDLVCASQSSATTAGLCKQPVAENAVCRRAVPNQCPIGQYCKDANPAVMNRAAPGVDGVCSDLPAAGQSCAAATSCMPYSFCSSTDSQCYAVQSLASTCSSSSECYGSRCEEGSCAPPLDCNAEP